MRKPIKPVSKLTLFDKLLDGLALAGLLFVWIYIAANYQQLSTAIPIHYNWKGEINGQASKGFIWMIPCLLTILFAGLTILNKYPQVFNYPTTITTENRGRQYNLAKRLLRFLKLVIVIVFIFISVETVNATHAGHSTIGAWLVPVLIFIMCLPTIIYLYMASKKGGTANENS